MKATLYYFHDPMCSWCYAFQPVWAGIRTAINDKLHVCSVLGGLAPDDDAPMPTSMQEHIQQHWRKIEEFVPGTRFNYDFWINCKPRRATYPACRAVIAATKQGVEFEEPMIHAIQRAYYLEARNPSDYSTHIELARALGMEVNRFEKDLISAATDTELSEQLRLVKKRGVRGFPSLILQIDDDYYSVPHDYNSAELTINAIRSRLKNNHKPPVDA